MFKKPKRSPADKIAEKAFASPAFQQSWQVHMRAFGPILASAFAGNAPARVHLCNALNHLSRRDTKRARELLDQIATAATTDADTAALRFFGALACESDGDSRGAIRGYRATLEVCDRFYLPYFKLARVAHVAAEFGEAADHYRSAIRCLMTGEATEQTRAQIAAMRTNLASVLTMLHDYEAAAAELATAKAELPLQPGREATEAVLAAALGDNARVEALIRVLETGVPQVAAETRRITGEILSGGHPHFSPMAYDPVAIDAFWQWCASAEHSINTLLTAKDSERVAVNIGEQLARLSPYLERPVQVFVEPAEDHTWTVTLGDYHMVALRTLYEDLLGRRPAGLLPGVSWQIGH